MVTEVGPGVDQFKAGDEVYVRLPEVYRGKNLITTYTMVAD